MSDGFSLRRRVEYNRRPTLTTPSVSQRKLKSPKMKNGTRAFCWSLWNRSRVCSSARRLLLQYTEGYVSQAARLLASWNKWMLTRSKVVPSTIHRVRRNPFRLHLHSGKNCCGNFDFSLIATDSMLPVWMFLPSTTSNSCVRKFQILMFEIES